MYFERASSNPRFFGIFDTLYKMDIPQTEIMDLYDGYYAQFYDEFVSMEEYDLLTYRELATESNGPILELGCGSGRITVPMSLDGWEITGLDLSRDILRMLRRKLRHQPREVRDRVQMLQADMADFSLDQKFGLILLPATNICLLHSNERRSALFNLVAEHLTPDGFFAFDFLVPDEERLYDQNNRVQAISAPSPSGKRFILMGQLYIPEEGVQLLNFYSEVVDRQGYTRRFLGGTSKAIVPESKYLELLAKAGLQVINTREYEQSSETDRPYLSKLFICRHAD